jgi:poly(3-hydroxybutyrate) depolymerase
MYQPASYGRNPAFVWPALVTAAASEMAAHFSKQFTSLAIGARGEKPPPQPKWTTPHRLALELKTVQLRDFSAGDNGRPCLLCTPFALHGSVVSDLAPGHSLVVALRDSGLTRLFVTDWRSASAEMQYLGIDDYLADLNVLVDEIGSPVDLIGLCQGGWMALIFAARFPRKVRKLVLAGAPVDTKAAPSVLSSLAEGITLEIFREVVRLGDGLVLGKNVLQLWGPETTETDEIKRLLASEEAPGSPVFAQVEAAFRGWYGWTVDLPGSYFLETVEKLYKRNEIAAGTFEALGKRIALTSITAPIFLLAARDDELVAPAQLFAVERLVGTPSRDLRKLTANCRHLGLFMSKQVLRELWPKIVEWLIKKPARLPKREGESDVARAA